jgi:hypothetical protein
MKFFTLLGGSLLVQKTLGSSFKIYIRTILVSVSYMNGTKNQIFQKLNFSSDFEN